MLWLPVVQPELNLIAEQNKDTTGKHNTFWKQYHKFAKKKKNASERMFLVMFFFSQSYLEFREQF